MVKDESTASLNESMVSVIRVEDKEDGAGDASLLLDQTLAKPEEAKGEEAAKEGGQLPIDKMELVLSELKTKHISEKRMLQCDITCLKKVIMLMAEKIRKQELDK